MILLTSYSAPLFQSSGDHVSIVYHDGGGGKWCKCHYVCLTVLFFSVLVCLLPMPCIPSKQPDYAPALPSVHMPN